MAANRSRTARWRECLEQVLDRGGGIEIAVRSSDAVPMDDVHSADLLWRVRLLALTAESMTVEMPGTMGQSYQIAPGQGLIGFMSIGQNRWSFLTSVVRTVSAQTGRREYPALELALPEQMERCRRRATDRFSTANVQLPEVRCWTLVDPESSIPAEIASQARMNELHRSRTMESPSAELEAVLLPSVGPESRGVLANIGGGGVGLQFERGESVDLDTRHTYWLRLDLRPWLPAPLAVTARLAHSYTDALGITHAGFAFDFSHHQSHRAFVVEQIGRCMMAMQSRRAAA